MTEKKPTNFFQETIHRTYHYGLIVKGCLRVLIAVLLLTLTIASGLYLSFFIHTRTLYLRLSIQIFGFLFAFYLQKSEGVNSYNLLWIIFCACFPTSGLFFYYIWGRKGRHRRQAKKFAESYARLAPYRKDPNIVLQAKKPENLPPGGSLQLQFLANKGYAAFPNNEVDYFPTGEAQFSNMIHDLKQAQDFIFLEYFIIAEGFVMDMIFEVLRKKADEGVKIRLLYDDLGCTVRVTDDKLQSLRNHGIEVVAFNNILTTTSDLFINNRLHQKLCLIDGKIAWLGGTNIGDEYVNIHPRFGYWKDSATRLQGDVCHNITLDFLHIWEQESPQPPDEDYRQFLPYAATVNQPLTALKQEDNLAVPFWDGPLGQGENGKGRHLYEKVLHSLINTSEKTIDILTPYFIIEPRMTQEICQAAQSGVRVRVIVPAVPDKKMVYIMTFYSLGRLLKSGCEVYIYKPGFTHAKTLSIDGNRAILGSANMDFRSLYLNFENMVYLYNHPIIEKVDSDFEDLLTVSQAVTYEDWLNRPLCHKIMEPLLRIFATSF